MKLSADGFERARAFLHEQARPLEAALFRYGFGDGPAEAVVETLAAFRNADGGFGHGLEPDLRLPASSALATNHALLVLREVGAPADHPLVAGAIGWLLDAFDPAIGAWRSVPREAEDHPHADHWKWELHESGTTWPVAALPRADLLGHLHHWAEAVPASFLDELTARFVRELDRIDGGVGADGLAACERLVQTAAAPADLREPLAKRLREAGLAMVNRDPEAWSTYVPKPLKLAPAPHWTLATPLAEDVARNLDWEIARQQPDGSWLPNWSWHGAYPEAWEMAKREWQGDLTLWTLSALRAWSRL